MSLYNFKKIMVVPPAKVSSNVVNKQPIKLNTAENMYLLLL